MGPGPPPLLHPCSPRRLRGLQWGRGGALHPQHPLPRGVPLSRGPPRRPYHAAPGCAGSGPPSLHTPPPQIATTAASAGTGTASATRRGLRATGGPGPPPPTASTTTRHAGATTASATVSGARGGSRGGRPPAGAVGAALGLCTAPRAASCPWGHPSGAMACCATPPVPRHPCGVLRRSWSSCSGPVPRLISQGANFPRFSPQIPRSRPAPLPPPQGIGIATMIGIATARAGTWTAASGAGTATMTAAGITTEVGQGRAGRGVLGAAGGGPGGLRHRAPAAAAAPRAALGPGGRVSVPIWGPVPLSGVLPCREDPQGVSPPAPRLRLADRQRQEGLRQRLPPGR